MWFNRFRQRVRQWNRMMAATLIGSAGLAAQAQPVLAGALPPLWDKLITVRSGVGYKDNVLLSHSAPEASPFLDLGAEVFVARLAEEEPQFVFFGNFDHAQYFSATELDQEQLGFARALWKQRFSEPIELSFSADGYYLDRVLDIDLTETNRVPVPVRGEGVTLRPAVRWSLPQQLFLGLEGTPSRQYFDEPLDHFWEGGVKSTVGWAYAKQSELSLTYGPSWRSYDHEPALTLTLDEIPNQTRVYLQNEVQLTWRHCWDEKLRWRTASRLGFRRQKDNGEGYFDYQSYYASQQVRFRSDPWEIRLEGRVRHVDYANQTISDVDGRRRNGTEVLGEVICERQLTKFLRASLRYGYLRGLSNDVLETFEVNTVTASLHWEF